MSPQPKRAARDAEPEQRDAGNVNGGELADPNREAVGLEPAWAEGSGGADTSGGGGPVREAPEPDPDPEPEQRRRQGKDD